MTTLRIGLAALAAVALGAASASAADLVDKMSVGTVELKSAGPLAFGPEGILFVGDPQAACVYAIDTGERPASPASGPLNVDRVNVKVAGQFAVPPADLAIGDLAANPLSGNAYLSVARGKGPGAQALIVRIDRAGTITEVGLKDVRCAKAALPNASEKSRRESITNLAYADGKVFVAGLSNEEFASNLRVIPFPFTGEASRGAGVEIYHGAHGKFETRAPVRTMTAYEINGQAHLLASYTCTPLVKFPVEQLKPGEKVRGTTVAELGNMNQPLDMVVYQKNGQDYLLLANSRRGVMKVSLAGIDKADSITSPITGGNQAGLKAEAIPSLQGVMQLAALDKEHALALIKTGDDLNLRTIDLP
jgi:hypothetical protein